MKTELVLNAKRYSNSFEQCYFYYVDYRDKMFANGSNDIAPEELIRGLRCSYLQFAISLYDELNVVSDWNEQNIIFTQLKLLMSDVIFDNDVLNTDKAILINDVVEMASSKEDGVLLIDLVQCMSDSLLWFRMDDRYRLASTLNVLKKQIPIYTEYVDHTTKYEKTERRAITGESMKITTDEEVGKNPITRDGTWFLFTTLRQKGVIKQMPDTELSELVSSLTEYSSEKLRQSKLHTQSSKDKLVSLLEDIITRIKT